MAERRMFSKTIIDSDMFLDMPLSAQALYFHLSMRADDDGFVNNPKKIQRMIGASDDDCRILLAKRFILSFESGIIVIRHWKLHNYIQKDRYKETLYVDEKSQLVTEKGVYFPAEIVDTKCIQNVSKVDTQVSIGEVSLGKDSLGKVSTEDEAQAEPALDAFTVQSKEVLDYLNEKAGKRYKAVDRNLKHIKARLREGFTVDDCKCVIDKKCAEWSKNERMNQYLRCETLFGGKFESYLNQNGQDKPEENGFWDVSPEEDSNFSLW